MSTVTIADRVADNGITISNRRATPTAKAARDYPGGSHWISTLNMGGRKLSVPFHQGSAHRSPPTAEDVLNALVSDASGFDNATSFEDYASEYGMPLDSPSERRDAKRLYDTVGRYRDKLYEWCETAGPTLYNNLLWHTEPL